MRAAEAMAQRIEKQVIFFGNRAAGGSRNHAAEIDDAVEDNWLFAMDGPGGALYYPAFYADITVARQPLPNCSQAGQQWNFRLLL